MEFVERLNRANGRLQAAKIPCRIQQLHQKLYLRATFPPPPGSLRETPYQQRLALGLPANPRGLVLAEEKAKLAGVALEAGRFDWAEWRKEAIGSVGEWVERFQGHFFGRGGQAATWKVDYQQAYNKLPIDAPLTLDLLKRAAETTRPNSRSRLRAYNAFRQLAEFAELGTDGLLALKGSYSASEVDPRSLPSDEQIVEWREAIRDPGWRWVYGMLAAYGMRPHEIYSCDLSDFPTVRVAEATKTGSRFIWPLYPEWADGWRLGERANPPLQNIEEYTNPQLGTKTSKFFERWGKLQSYDLRHCYARRCLEFGFAPEFGAKLMGHSPETHCRVYRRWIDEKTYWLIYQSGVIRSDRPRPPT